ncbi:FMN-binding glutamate synthase family protein [Methyloprofundus sp.]|uniref:FMN-binding glutamate synthase family protein n=1 Tax=Methyloprofundus sp. TaxID=2020875 RepID=UPI003D13DA2F
MRKRFYRVASISLILSTILTWLWPPAGWLLALVAGIVMLGLYDIFQTRHTILRNYPLWGHWRWIMEWLRPMIYQYFIESDTNGVPVNRMFRSVVYQRAKGVLDTVPLGTKMDTYRSGYEWMDHSLTALDAKDLELDPRIIIGGPDCKQPYSASILNISAMSFGALSKHAILALNGGAKIGGFAHNTGEGGLSPYHLEPGGDLIWQIGTGYFGCRDEQGGFSEQGFAEKASLDNIKMIEIKLSQGAKPGHGGILPAIKNTLEIAEIRGVQPNTQVNSPPTHSAFSTPLEMMQFIQLLREHSGGKPIGFKLCIGRKSEFIALCKAMLKTGIKPDFITVDGGEGGTGAAPLEYTNSVGTPLREGLAFVVDCLIGFDLKKDIRVIASGRIFSGFHMVRLLAQGADLCNSARGMMMALGCIQSLECNKNTCPTGVATQDPALYEGMNVADKRQRVENLHKLTVESVVELIAAAGLTSPDQLKRCDIQRRVSSDRVRSYDEIYPSLEPGCLLQEPYPEPFNKLLQRAHAEHF